MYRVYAFSVIAAVAFGTSSAQDTLSPVEEHIRRSVEIYLPNGNLHAGGQPIFDRTVLPEFYRNRVYRPAWSTGRNPGKVLSDLVAEIERVDEQGLKPNDYHLEAIRQILAQVRRSGAGSADSRTMAELDLLATDAFLILATHLQAGRVDPTTFDADWHATGRGTDAVSLMTRALESGDVAGALERTRPLPEGYGRLEQELAKYRRIEAGGGFSTVSVGPTLHPGDLGERVAELANRLHESADLKTPVSESMPVFDADIESAVRSFQRRHGLTDDGVVGEATLAALNVPVEKRIEQISYNLERWRWLAQDLGRVHIIVNIAAFELSVFEDGAEVMTKRVVTGRTYRRTPVFSGKMTYLVLSPYWHVPRRIAAQDKLPLIKKDPGYLATQGIRVFSGSYDRELDPSTVDWASITPANFNFQLRQDPGPLNALGRVKFMFPNRFNVYLHDTPSRELFQQAERAFSSGCIRVQDPLELAEYLLSDQPGWTRDRIEQASSLSRETTVLLDEPVSVHIQYWTAWVDPDGTIHFRKDIYGRDASLATAMNEPPPAAL